ncbi:hypothetical protein, partial [Echinicola sediminis]
TIVDVLINYGEKGNELFTGYLTQYSLCPQGNLDTLYLTGVFRYKKDQENNITFKDIPGDCFVIPYKNVLNMNVQYVIDEKKTTKLTKDYNSENTKRSFKKKISNVFKGLTHILLFFSFIGSVVYPWTTQVSVLWKIIGMFFLNTSWMFLTTWYTNFSNDQPKLGKLELRISLILFLITLLFSIYALGDWEALVITPLSKLIEWVELFKCYLQSKIS